MELLNTLRNQSKPFVMFVGFSLVAVIGLLDYLTGYELAFSLFYLLPISLVTWNTSKRSGFAVAVLSASVWLMADVFAGHVYTIPLIYLWNTIIRFGFFIVVVLLLCALRTSLEHEKELARTDPLTGAVNSRQFQELIRIETERLHRYRHPFTLVYMDLDNFKYMNDRFGHAAGDRLLREIVNYSQEHLRSTDAVARLGGDEFAYLLPETDQVAAQMVVRKIQSGLLKEMQKNKWPVTLSIGVLTCTESMDVVDQIISTADRLMYAVKRGGKNSVNYFVHEGMYVTDSPKPGTDENPGDGND